MDGSRVPVRRVYAFYRDGVKVETILKRYPQLEAAKVLDALAFALDNPEVIQADMEHERAILSRAGQRSRSRISDKQIRLPFGEEEDE